ncbi:hypothetical protein TVNIR_3105 [Thioalkalivibrio nitratireducens DSM 14787]|uniref:Uncharacterized protein n=1 Tax=Thioalkalivibrio nitratireducens (strain DSM 14787 / UNIQEM 213 / ALEN2) TaxID=1255043 RepID=L0E262_THIND|nr:hypothetical protein TVNIR_3105 [Thioalkalivibrio nitratireducens DSM 14787]
MSCLAGTLPAAARCCESQLRPLSRRPQPGPSPIQADLVNCTCFQ